MAVICKVSTHGEVVDHGGADDCHLYFGRDLVIVDGTAEVGVDPVNEQLLFLDFPVRVSIQKFLTAFGEFRFGIAGLVKHFEDIIQVFMPSCAQNLHLRDDSFPDLFVAGSGICPGSGPFLKLCKKGFSDTGFLVASADIFPLIQFVFVEAQLEIMGTGEEFFAAQFQGDGSVLYDGEKVISGVHQGSKKQIVKILVSFFGRGFFYGTEGCPVFPGEKNPGGLWTGQGEGIFAESLKFLNVSWVFSAGVTEHLRSGFAVNVAEIVFI